MSPDAPLAMLETPHAPAAAGTPVESGWGRLGIERAARRILGLLAIPNLPARWVVARKEGIRWRPVAMQGHSPGLAEPTVIAWHDSLCRYAAAAGEPLILGRIEPHDGAHRTEQVRRLGVAGYMGVPVLAHDGELYGSLCALFGQPVELQADFWRPRLSQASGLLHEQLRQAQAQCRLLALIARAGRESCLDPVTGLLDRRGWEALLAAEQARIERLGVEVGVVLFGVGDPEGRDQRRPRVGSEDLLRACADTLSRRLRPFDTLARLGDEGLGLLLADIPARHLESPVGRLTMALLENGVEASVGWASAGPRRPLAQALIEADHSRYLRRRAAPAGAGG